MYPGYARCTRAREIYLPEELAGLIRQRGYVYKGYPGSILKFLHRAQDALWIPRFKLHALRHYYASTAHAIGIPDSYIMQSGGWQSDNVLKSVYRHALDEEKERMQKQAAEYITAGRSSPYSSSRSPAAHPRKPSCI